MPIAFGSSTLPQGYVNPRWYNDIGYGYGVAGRQVADALLAALTGGRYQGTRIPTTPTPQQPGQLTFPSGATTATSPFEMAQIQQLGGVPSRTGQIMPLATPTQPGGVTYKLPMKWENVQRIINDLNIQKAQQQAAMYPLEIEAKQIEIENQRRMPQLLREIYGGGINPQQIEDDALAGDEDAIATYRYLKKRGM